MPIINDVNQNVDEARKRQLELERQRQEAERIRQEEEARRLSEESQRREEARQQQAEDIKRQAEQAAKQAQETLNNLQIPEKPTSSDMQADTAKREEIFNNYQFTRNDVPDNASSQAKTTAWVADAFKAQAAEKKAGQTVHTIEYHLGQFSREKLEREEAEAQRKAEEAKAKPLDVKVDSVTNTVTLKNGEQVDKSEWDKLDKDQQKTLYEAGVSGFNAIEEGKYQDSIKDKVELDNGDWVDKTEYGKLTATQREYLQKNGVDAFNEKYGEKKKTVYVAKNEPEAQFQLYSPELKPIEKLTESQEALKQVYQKQEEYNNLSLLERLKQLPGQLFQNLKAGPFGTNYVIKGKDGKYREVSEGTATAIAGPGSVSNILKVVTALTGAASVISTAGVLKKVEDYVESQAGKKTTPLVMAVDTANDSAIMYEPPAELSKDYIELMEAEPVLLTKLSTPIFKPLPVMEVIPANTKLPDLPGFAYEKPDVILIESMPKVITDAEDFIAKSSAVAEAEEVLDKAQTGLSPQVIKEIEEIAEKAASKDISNWSYVQKNYLTLYEDYLRRQKILEDAKKTFVASSNPTPIKGNTKELYAYILAGYKIATYISTRTDLNNKQKLRLADQIADELSRDTTQKNSNALKNTLMNGLRYITKPRPITRTKTYPSTSTATSTSVAESTRTAEVTDTVEATDTAETEAAREATRTADITRSLTARAARIAKVKLPKGGSPKDKGKKTIPVKRGSVVFEQGKLEVDASHPGPETVYKIGEPPDYKVRTSFKKPKGYRDTGDTPKNTIQTIGGPVKRNVDVRIGKFTAHAQPDSKEIKFTRNDQVSGKVKPISDRNRGISERQRMPTGRRSLGITPRTPRLR